MDFTDFFILGTFVEIYREGPNLIQIGNFMFSLLVTFNLHKIKGFVDPHS